MRCQSCNVATINGVRCHETGCPDAWRDHVARCRECGCKFKPETRHHTVCQDCIEAEMDRGEPEDFGAAYGTDGGNGILWT